MVCDKPKKGKWEVMTQIYGLEGGHKDEFEIICINCVNSTAKDKR